MNNSYERKSRKSAKLLEDLIVLGLPFATTEEEFKTYFTDTCGELGYVEVWCLMFNYFAPLFAWHISTINQNH